MACNASHSYLHSGYAIQKRRPATTYNAAKIDNKGYDTSCYQHTFIVGDTAAYPFRDDLPWERKRSMKAGKAIKIFT